ncbi:MAG: dipeptidase [Melioribacteraceae bacterium]|nr:dipeptidase [Melioribacteraceae bacterium]
MLKKANNFLKKNILIDTHIDLPSRLLLNMEDITKQTSTGDFDLVRAKKGGLAGAFAAIYVPVTLEESGALNFANSQIDLMEEIVREHQDILALAPDINTLQQNHKNKLFSFILALENGAPISGNLENLHYFFERGIRYLTLAHSRNNHICDSSYDDSERWSGLSDFGIELIQEMNLIGMMIDVSHVSDKTFYDVLKYSKLPIAATHSSCRHFTPGWERNMSDEMIKDLATNGGVIQINFGSDFLRGDILERSRNEKKEISEILKRLSIPSDSKEADEIRDAYKTANPKVFATISDVANHIDHVVDLVGIDYVGIGSDYDGLGDQLPEGLKDVSSYPNLIAELFNRGYSEEYMKKICSDNFIRVWKSNEESRKTNT